MKFLIDTDVIEYFFIDERLADQVCEKLQIIYVRLNWLKSVEEYNDQMILKFIIYIIYSTFTVKDYKELTALMFITCLRHQDAILRSSWMICYDVWSDLINHSIVYTSHFCNYFETDYLWTWSLLKFLDDAAKQQKTTENSQKNNSFKIYEINAAVYHTFMKQLKEENIQFFFLLMHELNKKLKFLS